jgi:hypothetical protein
MSLLRSRQVVGLWRDDLRKVNPKAAEALADPSQYANLFPNMAEALQAESLQVCSDYTPAVGESDLARCWQQVTAIFPCYTAFRG